MLDPLPPPPAWLRSLSEPLARYLNLPALSDHIHETLGAFALYLFIHLYVSPRLSPLLAPSFYPKFDRRTKTNWDVRVVSFVQSSMVNVVALWVMFSDEERKSMNSAERIYGYTGATSLILGLATGYFMYDLIISVIYVKIFGMGMLFHGISALWVFSMGFRPFLNFYSPTFILYELSSPFLNIHWFLDKVNMTGSRAQWYNGMALLFVFFCCRLVWGTWQSAWVYVDMWRALRHSGSGSPVNPLDIFQSRDRSMCVDKACVMAKAEVSKYSAFTANGVPTWLVITYVVSNVILNCLNYFWFSKMIETVMKRFRETLPAEAEKKEEGEAEMLNLKEKVPQNAVLDAASKLEQEEGSLISSDEVDGQVRSAVDTGADALRRRKGDLVYNNSFPPAF